MKKRIKYIFIGTLIIFLFSATSGYSIDNIKSKNIDNITPPLPGCIEGEKPILETKYIVKNTNLKNEFYQVFQDEEIVNLILKVDEAMILGYLEELTAFGPRVTTTPECEAAGRYIYSEFKDMGLNVRYHNWSSGNLFGSNIEATINGLDETSDKIYIICAHYDSVPGSPGADDDGSGTAAVMAAANVMSQYGFNNTVRFVTFSGEEQGLYGSYYYAEEAYENSDNIIAVLNVDMIGFAPTEEDARKIRVYENEASEWVTEFTTTISHEYYPYLKLEVIPSGFTWGSDHYYFWEFGYYAIFYAEYNFNDYYHSPQDIIENMNIEYATNSTRLIIATLAEFSQLVDIRAPFKPNTPMGQINGKTETEYTYTTSTTDPQNDDIFYWFNWGDNTNSGWLGPFSSGDTCEATHTWDKQGSYEIKVKAKDINDAESEWSDPLVVSMPKNKLVYRYPILYRFQKQHPHLFPILRLLMKI